MGMDKKKYSGHQWCLNRVQLSQSVLTDGVGNLPVASFGLGKTTLGGLLTFGELFTTFGRFFESLHMKILLNCLSLYGRKPQTY